MVYKVKFKGAVLGGPAKKYAFQLKEGKKVHLGKDTAGLKSAHSTALPEQWYLYIEEGNLYVVDDHSKDGLFLNGEKINQHIVKTGDVLQMGEFSIEFLEVPYNEDTDDSRTGLIEVEDKTHVGLPPQPVHEPAPESQSEPQPEALVQVQTQESLPELDIPEEKPSVPAAPVSPMSVGNISTMVFEPKPAEVLPIRPAEDKKKDEKTDFEFETVPTEQPAPAFPFPPAAVKKEEPLQPEAAPVASNTVSNPASVRPPVLEPKEPEKKSKEEVTLPQNPTAQPIPELPRRKFGALSQMAGFAIACLALAIWVWMKNEEAAELSSVEPPAPQAVTQQAHPPEPTTPTAPAESVVSRQPAAAPVPVSEPPSERLVNEAQKGDLESVKSLLEQKVDPDSISSRGGTALTTAAREGHLQIVEVLLAKGAKINFADTQGTTPLIWAAANGHKDVVAVLLKAGANARHTAKNGETAYQMAIRRGQKEIAKLLSEENPPRAVTPKPKVAVSKPKPRALPSRVKQKPRHQIAVPVAKDLPRPKAEPAPQRQPAAVTAPAPKSEVYPATERAKEPAAVQVGVPSLDSDKGTTDSSVLDATLMD